MFLSVSVWLGGVCCFPVCCQLVRAVDDDAVARPDDDGIVGWSVVWLVGLHICFNGNFLFGWWGSNSKGREIRVCVWKPKQIYTKIHKIVA